jgi:cysteinyl-tRNA synthetase
MVLRLYDTGAKQEREFVPHRAGSASMYVCGATVQGPPHLGHLRSAVVYDVLRRWLTRAGLDVLFVRNVTDIEDKILAAGADAGRPWWEWAAAHERAFDAAYRAVGCLPPSISPRATGHVPQMIELIHRLIDGDHAYAVPGGDVYFDVHSYPDYGGLSGQRVEQVRPGDPGPDGTGKRDTRDFTLWKAARPGEPSWPSPWGRGRPAWHLECSAMSTTYLGAEFDIHGGGRDLLFPHHENERAQSRSAGDGFARYWTHNVLITAAGEKMSKSIGNTVSVDALLRHVGGARLRYFLVAPHYRSVIEYSDPALAEAGAAYGRIESFLHRLAERHGPAPPDEALPREFVEALDADLATPAAVATIHRVVRDGNRALDRGDAGAACSAGAAVRAMVGVLGLDPLTEAREGSAVWTSAATESALSALVDQLLRDRENARALRDFVAADAVRRRLLAAGVQIRDTPDGPTWSLAGDGPPIPARRPAWRMGGDE